MSKHLGMDIRVPIECDNPSIQRDEEKCIKCGPVSYTHLPDGLIFGIGMPVGVLLMIGLIAEQQTISQENYTFLQSAFASLITVGICATAFMGIPLTIANYRDKKILKHFFVTPMSPKLILCVQFCIGAIISILSALLVSI